MTFAVARKVPFLFLGQNIDFYYVECYNESLKLQQKSASIHKLVICHKRNTNGKN